VHAVGLLDTSKDAFTNVEGSFLNVATMVTSKLLVVTSLPYDGGESLFFEAVEDDAKPLLPRRTGFVELRKQRR
jgi:hypothetical protein